MIPFDLGPWTTAIASLGSAVLAAFVSIYTIKSKTKTDIATSITTGFQALTDQLQEERKELRATIDAQSTKIAAQSEKIESLQDDIRTLSLYIDVLKHALRTAGVKIPDKADGQT